MKPYISRLLEHKEIVSPFIGGGSIELYFASMGVRVHAADHYYYLVNFWNMMQIRAGAVVDRVWQWWEYGQDGTDLCALIYELTDTVDQAALFWMINKASWSGLSLAGSAITVAKNGVQVSFDTYEKYKDFNSDTLSIDLLDFRESLEMHENLNAYLDPPYVKRSKIYGDGKQPEFPHEELRDMLADRKTAWVLSYNDDDYIQNLYKDFYVNVIPWTVHSTPEGSAEKTELLISNFEPRKDINHL